MEEVSSSNYSIQSLDYLFERVYTLIWNNISVDIPINKSFINQIKGLFSSNKKCEQKSILNNVSGRVESGQFLAILGASGVGKSTLLNVLTGRNRGALEVNGQVTINGYQLNKIDPNLIAYVQQIYIFSGLLTVREHLIFQAMLQMNPNISYNEKISRIETLLQELGLKKCENSKIGHLDKGISGGEKRRLAFASELLTDPPIFICDEPTTGMDSFMAESVVNILKQFSKQNKIVLCTIHQPSSEVFALFDRLLLLANGHTAYFGDAHLAIDYFSNLGYVCPEMYNPADYFIHTLAKKHQLNNQWTSSSIVDLPLESISEGLTDVNITERKKLSKERLQALKCPYKVSWLYQVRWLLWRSFLCTFRNPILCYVRLFQKSILGILFGLIFFQLQPTQELVMNLQGAIYAFITELVWPTVLGILNTFYPEIPLFLREYHNGLYKAHAYYVAKVITWIPLFLIEAFLFAFISYWMIGFAANAAKFLYTLFFMLMASVVSASYGALMATSVSSLEVAIAFSFPLISMWNMLAGFFLNIKSIPSYVSWLQYLDWMRYTNEAINIIQWETVSNLTCSSDVRHKCYHSGEEVLASLHMHPDNMKWNIIGLIFLIVGYNFLAYLFLLKKTLNR